MPDDYLERTREYYNTDPMWKKIDYTPFPYQNLLEEAGYKVKDFNDFAKLQVYDADTGEKLKLTLVDHHYIDFRGSDNKYIRISSYGRVAFKLPNNERCDVRYFKNSNSIEYLIGDSFTFHVDYVTNLENESGADKTIADMRLESRHDFVRVSQRVSDVRVHDPFGAYETGASAWRVIPIDTVKNQYLSDVFQNFIEMLRKQDIPNKIDITTLNFVSNVISVHIREFLEYRNNDEVKDMIIASYEKDIEEVKQQYEETISKMEATLNQLKASKKNGKSIEEMRQESERLRTDCLAIIDKLNAARENGEDTEEIQREFEKLYAEWKSFKAQLDEAIYEKEKEKDMERVHREFETIYAECMAVMNQLDASKENGKNK